MHLRRLLLFFAGAWASADLKHGRSGVGAVVCLCFVSVRWALGACETFRRQLLQPPKGEAPEVLHECSYMTGHPMLLRDWVAGVGLGWQCTRTWAPKHAQWYSVVVFAKIHRVASQKIQPRLALCCCFLASFTAA